MSYFDEESIEKNENNKHICNEASIWCESSDYSWLIVDGPELRTVKTVLRNFPTISQYQMITPQINEKEAIVMEKQGLSFVENMSYAEYVDECPDNIFETIRVVYYDLPNSVGGNKTTGVFPLVDISNTLKRFHDLNVRENIILAVCLATRTGRGGIPKDYDGDCYTFDEIVKVITPFSLNYGTLNSMKRYNCTHKGSNDT